MKLPERIAVKHTTLQDGSYGGSYLHIVVDWQEVHMVGCIYENKYPFGDLPAFTEPQARAFAEALADVWNRAQEAK